MIFFFKQFLYLFIKNIRFKFVIINILLFIFCSLFINFYKVSAAEILFESTNQNISVGDQFEIRVFINTVDETVNAFDGSIIFSKNIIELKEIKDGNSIVNFWIDRPSIAIEQKNDVMQELVFSGITPGGFNGERGLIFSIIFEAIGEGVGSIKINEASILRHDGVGSKIPFISYPLSFQIIKYDDVIRRVQDIKDIYPPESFVPKIIRDANILDGKWIAIFATQDKKSGISHFEIKETRSKIYSNIIYYCSLFPPCASLINWNIAESPYVLRDQTLQSYVLLKAVDRAQNIRIEKISPINELAWYQNYDNWIIIIIIFLLLYVIIKINMRAIIKYKNKI